MDSLEVQTWMSRICLKEPIGCTELERVCPAVERQKVYETPGWCGISHRVGIERLCKPSFVFPQRFFGHSFENV